jgi:SAM-dependent methyltransferase
MKILFIGSISFEKNIYLRRSINEFLTKIRVLCDELFRLKKDNLMFFLKRWKSLESSSPSPRIEILRAREEYAESTSEIQKIGLSGHHDPQKNWDLWLSINSCRSLSRKANLLDAGSGSKAVFANSVSKLGFKNSYACDLQRAKGKRIISSVQDISKTNYPGNFFEFVVCHSVIEHGVSLDNFLREMFRITKDGGMLAVSTDFWPIEEDHSDKYPYGLDQPPMKLFSNKSFAEFLSLASSIGWNVAQFEGIEEFTPRPVEWPRMNSEYTFIWALFTKAT